MKTGLIVSGVVILLVDFAAWLLLDAFSGFHAAVVAGSVAISMAMQVFVISWRFADAFKIVLGGILGATGFIRIVLCVFLPRAFGANTVFFLIILIIALELSAMTWAYVASKHHQETAPSLTGQGMRESSEANID